jgi:hypothetical protein
MLATPAYRRLAPFVFVQNQSQASGLSADVLQALRNAYLADLRHNLIQHQEMMRLLARLAAADIAAIPLKGTLLGKRLHGEDAFRPTADLDIFVRERDIAAASALLCEAGYEASPDAGRYDIEFHRPSRGQIPYSVELHRGLGYLAGSALPWQASIWERTREACENGVSYLEMEPGDEFLYLCLNLVRHRFEDASLALDIHLAVERWSDCVDWDVLAQRAGESGLSAYLAIACCYARHCFGTVIPAPLLSGLAAWKLGWFRRLEWSGILPALFKVLPLSKHIHSWSHLLVLSGSWPDRKYHIRFAWDSLRRISGGKGAPAPTS